MNAQFDPSATGEAIDTFGIPVVLLLGTYVLVRVVKVLFDRLAVATEQHTDNLERQRDEAERLAAARLERNDLLVGEIVNLKASRDYHRALAQRFERDLAAERNQPPPIHHEGDTPS